MRLTLRTLLAYLDDTLPSAEIKQIGEKVAESDAAQELMARIRQVTRRRRLTTPPTTGPGAFEPNDVAEYLDNALHGDEVSELEKQCLESDVHLAEIAACHQILTLVLGEPALVPPTARERMYGLVKGKESIPYRKATTVKKPSGNGTEDEELLGLSVGWLRWVLPVAGLLLIVALGLAIAQVVTSDRDDGRRVSVDRRGKDSDSTPHDGQGKDSSAATPDKGKTDKDRTKRPQRDTDRSKPPQKDRSKPADQGEPKPDGPSASEVGRRPPPSQERAAVASYAGSYESLPGMLIRRKPEATGPDGWEKVKRGTPIQSTDTLVSLPGFTNVVQTPAVSVVLRGNVPQFALAPPQLNLLESAVVLHKSKDVDLDLSLLRGRIFLTNRKDKGPARIRLRFGEREVWDIALADFGDQIGVDFFSLYDYQINHRAGEEPRSFLFLVLVRGEAKVTVNDVDAHTRRAEPPRSYLFVWDSFSRAKDPFELKALPASWRIAPPTIDEVKDEGLVAVKRMTAALKDLEVRLSADKPVNIAIKEGLSKEDPMARYLSIYCQGAIDDVGNLVDDLADDDTTHSIDRKVSIFTLKRWLARGPRQARVLFHKEKEDATGVLIDKKYKVGEAKRIVDLLFDLPVETWRRPETFDLLARYLRDSRVAIAELAYFHLLQLAPGAKLPPFNAAESREERGKVATAIEAMIAKKQLPPPRKEAPEVKEPAIKPKNNPDDE